MGPDARQYWTWTALAAYCGAAARLRVFQLGRSPAAVTGGVGSPLNPIAINTMVESD